MPRGQREGPWHVRGESGGRGTNSHVHPALCRRVSPRPAPVGSRHHHHPKPHAPQTHAVPQESGWVWGQRCPGCDTRPLWLPAANRPSARLPMQRKKNPRSAPPRAGPAHGARQGGAAGLRTSTPEGNTSSGSSMVWSTFLAMLFLMSSTLVAGGGGSREWRSECTCSVSSVAPLTHTTSKAHASHRARAARMPMEHLWPVGKSRANVRYDL